VTTDDASAEQTHSQDERADPPTDDVVARLERLFEVPIGETGMAVHFDPEAESS
jgi:hypothetical protein